MRTGDPGVVVLPSGVVAVKMRFSGGTSIVPAASGGVYTCGV
jgi:hypothetical protein